MIPLKSNQNVDNSDPGNYPDGRVKDNTGTGNGTPVDRNVYGDLHSNISRLMRLYGITPSGLPDNETNGYQIISAISALASKNDYIYPLATDGTVLSVDIKLSFMNTNEFLVCLASADKGSETTIKGSNNTAFSVTYSGNFKLGEYVRVIKTNVGVSIIRIADWNSLDSMVAELNYLKKASQAQENAGTSDVVATTPLVNKVTFARRVNGVDSSTYLSSASQNGLMSSAQFNQLASLTNNVKNVGWFSGFDPGGSNTPLPVGGNLVSANAYQQTSSSSLVEFVLQNAMANTNYFVRMHIQSQSGDIFTDNGVASIVFKPLSTTLVQVSMSQIRSAVQNLKIHVEVVQL